MSSIGQGVVRIGTSGIVLPGPKATFPEEFRSGSRLHYYGSLFNTLEINSSFYKVPLATTFAKWATEVPDNFKFTVKLWRGITHAPRLAYTAADIDAFMDAADCLGQKRGCLLIQFPASITFSYLHQVTRILEHLGELNSEGHWQLAIEVRHASWYQDAAYAVFAKYKASLVLHDMPTSNTPQNLPAKDIAYFRFHGPMGDYKGSYSDEFLQAYAEKINGLRTRGIDVYVYFNNTIEGALENAQSLQKLLMQSLD